MKNHKIALSINIKNVECTTLSLHYQNYKKMISCWKYCWKRKNHECFTVETLTNAESFVYYLNLKIFQLKIKYVLVQSYVLVISASFDATPDYIAIGHLAIDNFHYRNEFKHNNTANYSKIHKLYPQLRSIWQLTYLTLVPNSERIKWRPAATRYFNDARNEGLPL